jgi:hypothetical protein
LLSTQNPDDYTGQFGCYATDEAGLVSGLKQLLYADNWKHLGKKGYGYVKQVHSTEKGVQNHLDLYKEVLA